MVSSFQILKNDSRQIERGGRHGGIPGQASIMMATANGVDTQPVLRGVWLLENILGDPVPNLLTSLPWNLIPEVPSQSGNF